MTDAHEESLALAIEHLVERIPTEPQPPTWAWKGVFWLTGILVVSGLAWCTWVTMTLTEVSINVRQNTDAKTALDQHVLDTGIHHQGITTLTSQLQLQIELTKRLEHRVSKLEEGI